MSDANLIPNLEERFLEPPGWRWHYVSHGGRKMRFGAVSPPNSIPDAIVVCLPGLSEFAEKYFETARDCLSKNLSFWIMDWMGQGKSDRYFKNSQKRHSRGFQRDVDDLHAFILGYVKHSAVHPDVGRLPMAMLAHSMGGNLGLHYLAEYPDVFECAAFSTPMVGIKTLESIPLAPQLAKALKMIAGKSYVYGMGDWTPEHRPNHYPNNFSSDPTRDAIHNAWCLTDPALQVGGVTYGWLYHAEKSCATLRRKNLLQSIKTHCLIAQAGHENIVSNAAIKKAVDNLCDVKFIEFPEAAHEILMEKDDIRKEFLNAFYEMIVERIIKRPETLKPF